MPPLSAPSVAKEKPDRTNSAIITPAFVRSARSILSQRVLFGRRPVRRATRVAAAWVAGIAVLESGAAAGGEPSASGIASARVIDPVSASYTRPLIMGGNECGGPDTAARCAGRLSLEGGASVEYSLSVTQLPGNSPAIELAGSRHFEGYEWLGVDGSGTIAISGGGDEWLFEDGESLTQTMLIQVSYH